MTTTSNYRRTLKAIMKAEKKAKSRTEAYFWMKIYDSETGCVQLKVPSGSPTPWVYDNILLAAYMLCFEEQQLLEMSRGRILEVEIPNIWELYNSKKMELIDGLSYEIRYVEERNKENANCESMDDYAFKPICRKDYPDDILKRATDHFAVTFLPTLELKAPEPGYTGPYMESFPNWTCWIEKGKGYFYLN